MISGNSTIAQAVNAPPPMSPIQKFESLSKGAQTAIIASAGSVALILLSLFIFCCVKQRRAGRRERKIADAQWEKGTAEVMAFRTQMGRTQQNGYSRIDTSYGGPKSKF